MKKYVLVFLLNLLFFHFNTVFAIDPDREYIRTPDSVNWTYEQLEVNTKDGIRLHSWIYEPNQEKEKDMVLILAYPDAGNMSYFVFHAMILANSGYTVVTFDYRGFGKSDDFEIHREYLYYNEFAWDLEAVVDTISEKFQNKKIGIWGMSMGTTITSRAYPQIKNQIAFIIGDGYVTDPNEIVDRYKKLDKKILLPEKPNAYKKAVESIECPLLILAASNDQVTTYSAALKLQKKLGGNCHITKYEGDHLTGFQVDYENKGFGGWYLEQLERFTGKVES